MSTNVGMGPCCISGTIHQGTPKGEVKSIGGLPTYVATPESKSKAQTVVFITDIFGYELPNPRLLADEYAKNGFTVYIPDILKGDALPHSFLNSIEPPLKVRENDTLWDKAKETAHVAVTLPPWLAKHPESTTRPIIEHFIDSLRRDSDVGKIGTVGFCYGGRYAILTAQGKADAAFACHPALVSIPGDFDDVTKPLAIAVGTKDSMLDEKSADQIKEVLDKKDVPTELVKYENQVHGFTVRGDWSSDEDKKAMDDAMKQGVAWFKKHLA